MTLYYLLQFLLVVLKIVHSQNMCILQVGKIAKRSVFLCWSNLYIKGRGRGIDIYFKLWQNTYMACNRWHWKRVRYWFLYTLCIKCILKWKILKKLVFSYIYFKWYNGGGERLLFGQRFRQKMTFKNAFMSETVLQTRVL